MYILFFCITCRSNIKISIVSIIADLKSGHEVSGVFFIKYFSFDICFLKIRYHSGMLFEIYFIKSQYSTY